jgi:hypothetical protein
LSIIVLIRFTMQDFNITVDSTVSYELLTKYHFTVKMLYDSGYYKSFDQITNYSFKLTVKAEDKEEAELLAFNYLSVFNNLEAIHHVGHVVFITQALINNEGQYINTEAPKNDKALIELEPLVNLLSIKEGKKFDSINIEITSKTDSNKYFDFYSKFSNINVLEKMIDGLVETQYNHFKSLAHEYTFDMNNRINQIDKPTLANIKMLADQAQSVSSKAFKADFLYTVCHTLLTYLNDCSHLNPDNRTLTNDEARIIYATCQMHGLLSVTHDVEVDALNYIRMVLNNKKDVVPMNITINEELD